jgi:hypothetical protein
MSVICESYIDGTFKGWSGHTVYKLGNGQYWEQAGYFYHYHYAYRPHITILDNGNGYEMHVQGDSYVARVKRVK